MSLAIQEVIDGHDNHKEGQNLVGGLSPLGGESIAKPATMATRVLMMVCRLVKRARLWAGMVLAIQVLKKGDAAYPASKPRPIRARRAPR